MNKPLSNIRVIDCTFYVAGPSCGKCLSEWGAEVIKIEPPTGDPGRTVIPGDTQDSDFENYNNTKKGIVINMKNPEGVVVLKKLLATADVFLTSYRTNALKKLGLDYESLSKEFPKPVWAQVNGFGDEGPDADAPGFDTVAYWARSGLMNDFVETGTPIIIPPVGFGDANAGVTLAGGIAAALYEREKTGHGDKVMLSLYGQAIYNLGHTIVDIQQHDGVYPKSRTWPAVPLMNSFKCKDGKWIYMAVLEHDRYYASVMKLIDREDLVDDRRFKSIFGAAINCPAFTAILDEGFMKYTQEEWIAKLTEADIAFSPVCQTADIVNDPQAIENNFVRDYTYRDGTSGKIAMGPIQFGNIELDEFTNAPRRGGEDTVEIMEGLGYTKEQIKELVELKAVKAIWKD